MRYHVIINTYDREDRLFNLLCQLRAYKLPGDELDIHVYTDGCKYSPMTLAGVTHHEMKHHGRQNYYKLFEQNIKDAYSSSWWDLCVKIDDDMEIVEDFYDELIRATHKPLQDRYGKTVINLLLDQRDKMWGGDGRQHLPRPVFITDWTDLNFICNRDFISEAISIKFTPPNMDTSSGVASQLTKHMREAGCKFFQVRVSLLIHGDHESKMNPGRKDRGEVLTNVTKL